MGRIGYVAATDRVRPREAVDLAVLAEAAGFDGTLVTDLFQPWLPSPVAGSAGSRFTPSRDALALGTPGGRGF